MEIKISFNKDMKELCTESEIFIKKSKYNKEEARLLLIVLIFNTSYRDYVDEYNSRNPFEPFDLVTVQIASSILMEECSRRQLTFTMNFLDFALEKIKG